jgi:hypothetical protein
VDEDLEIGTQVNPAGVWANAISIYAGVDETTLDFLRLDTSRKPPERGSSSRLPTRDEPRRPLSAAERRIREIELWRIRPVYEEQSFEDFLRDQERRRHFRELIDRKIATIRRQIEELESSER